MNRAILKKPKELIYTMPNVKSVTLFLQSMDDSKPDELRPDRRDGVPDRRKINTYIANDRRSGIADRRKRLSISLVFDGSFYSEMLKRAFYSSHRTG
jgi:hypothetical protein